MLINKLHYHSVKILKFVILNKSYNFAAMKMLAVKLIRFVFKMHQIKRTLNSEVTASLKIKSYI